MIEWLRSRDALSADFVVWAGPRFWLVLVLITIGALLEGIGIATVLPLLGLVMESTDNALTQAVSFALDTLGITGRGPQMYAVAVCFTLLIVLRFVVFMARDKLSARLENDFVAYKRGHLFGLIAAQPWHDAAVLNHGKVGHAISRDLDRSTGAIVGMMGFVSNIVMLTVYLVLSLLIAPLLTVLMFIAGAAIYRALLPLRAGAAQSGKAMTRDDAGLHVSTDKFLRGLKTAKAHGAELSYVERLRSSSAEVSRHLIDYRIYAALSGHVLTTLVAILSVSIIVIGNQMLGMGAAEIVVSLALLARLAARLQAIQQTVQSIYYGREAYRSAMAQIEDRFAGSGAISSPAPQAPQRGLDTAPELQADEVSYSHPGSPGPVITDLTATVPAGRLTIVAGPSGVGKTTLVDLLIGLAVPQTGKILLNGHPLTDQNLPQLRASLAYVGQDALLLEPTLRAALTGNRTDIDDAAIDRALHHVGAADLVRDDEHGLDMPLVNAGSMFSGGERQRLRLAAAILREPRILVLDEATNALDLASERSVLQGVSDACPQATILMISHRPELIDMADHIIDLTPDWHPSMT